MHKIFKIILLGLAFLAMSLADARAQQQINSLPNLDWYKFQSHFAGTQWNRQLRQTDDGSVYQSGAYVNELIIGILGTWDYYFRDTVEWAFDNDYHGYLMKLDAQGTFQWNWIVRGDSGSWSRITGVDIDANGDIIVVGNYAGVVQFPGGAILRTTSIYRANGFLAKLSPAGQTLQLTNIGGPTYVVTDKIFCGPHGTTDLMLGVCRFPLIVGQDTINGNSLISFMAVIKLDSDGHVTDFTSFQEYGNAESGHFLSARDSVGNVYLSFYTFGPNFGQGNFSHNGQIYPAQAYQLLKLSPTLDIEWVRGYATQPNGYPNAELEAFADGVYLSAEAKSNDLAFLEKYETNGEVAWSLKSRGYNVVSEDIAFTKDFIYWSGHYECNMRLDAVHFVVADTAPCVSNARDGFIALVNRHTGRLAWAISDGNPFEIKWFSEMVAAPDGHLLMVVQAYSPNCTLDTVVLPNIPQSVLPLTVLVQFSNLPPLPIWPEVLVPPVLAYDFGVYPNPTAGVVTVETNDFWGEHLQLEIYNSLGQRLRLQPLTAVQTSLDLSGMRSEVLWLRLTDLDSGLHLTKRLVLVH